MSTVSLWYENDDYTVEACGHTWMCSVFCEGDYYSTSGMMYMPNGDPGYPPEEDFNITKLEVTDIYSDTGEPPDEKQRAEITEKVEEEMNEMDKGNWGGWEADYDD